MNWNQTILLLATCVILFSCTDSGAKRRAMNEERNQQVEVSQRQAEEAARKKVIEREIARSQLIETIRSQAERIFDGMVRGTELPPIPSGPFVGLSNHYEELDARLILLSRFTRPERRTFETQDEYDARTHRYRIDATRLHFIPVMGFSYGSEAYDADREVLRVTFGRFAHYSRNKNSYRHMLFSNITEGEFLGENAFGVKRTITRREGTEWGLQIDNMAALIETSDILSGGEDSGRYSVMQLVSGADQVDGEAPKEREARLDRMHRDRGYLVANIPIPPDEARTIARDNLFSDQLSFAVNAFLVVSVNDSKIISRRDVSTATFERPREDRIDQHFVSAKVKALVLYDWPGRASGERPTIRHIEIAPSH